MPTKTSPSRRSTSRAPSRPASKKATSKRPAAKKSQPRKKPQRAPTTQILSPFARDTLGIGLMVLAGLAVLSVWFDAAGPMGDAFSRLLARRVRTRRGALPAHRVGVGHRALARPLARGTRAHVHRLRGHGARRARPALARTRQPQRVRARARHGRAAGANVAGFGDAGGFFGTLGAYPLSKIVSPAGAFLIDLGLTVIGALIMTGTSFAELGRKVRSARSNTVMCPVLGSVASSSELQPASGNDVRRAGVLRHVQRILVAHVDDGRSNLDPPRPCADRGKQRKRRAELAREMVHPEIRAVEAQLLRGNRQFDRLE